jgi:LmbE family N-acetylglucosaminyl deacetylase
MSGSIKLRIYHRPWLVVLAFTATMVTASVMALLVSGGAGTVFIIVAAFYGLPALAAAVLAVSIGMREGELTFMRAEKVLIVSPHQDDCVLTAGGIGLCNQANGGETHIAYLVQPGDARIAALRREEAAAAWRIAGVDERFLYRLSGLPAEGDVSRRDVGRCATELQQLVDNIAPTVVITPAFEGGHIHHDIVNCVVTRMLRMPPDTRIFEGLEYSPYFSVWRTPQATLSHLTRIFFFGLVLFYSKPEGVGRGRIQNARLAPEQLKTKIRMLRAFRSQNGDALARNNGFEDRLIAWTPRPFQATPFTYYGSRPWLIEYLQAFMPLSWILRLLPGEPCTIGLKRGITDLRIFIGTDTVATRAAQ